MRIFYILLLGLLMSACNHVFYQPDSYQYAKPEDFKVPVKAFTLKTEDQETIHAWLLNDVPQSKGVVLHFHGNAQNMTAHVSFCQFLLDAGYTVVVFDYRGYGASTGKPSQQAVLKDGTAVIQWMQTQRQWDKKPKIVFAQSLGGAIAAPTLAKNPEFAKSVYLLVIDSSFGSYRATARAVLGGVWLTWALQYPLSFLVSDDAEQPREAVKKLAMPKIFVHGDRDTAVPYALGQDYFAAAAEPKEFWTIPFGKHTEAFYPGSPWQQKLLDRLAKLSDSKP